MKIIWSPLSVERLEEIYDFIGYDKPASAKKWTSAVFDKVELLKSNPKLGRIVPEIENQFLRELFFGNYRIIYRYSKTTITILTIRSTREILPKNSTF